MDSCERSVLYALNRRKNKTTETNLDLLTSSQQVYFVQTQEQNLCNYFMYIIGLRK